MYEGKREGEEGAALRGDRWREVHRGCGYSSRSGVRGNPQPGREMSPRERRARAEYHSPASEKLRPVCAAISKPMPGNLLVGPGPVRCLLQAWRMRFQFAAKETCEVRSCVVHGMCCRRNVRGSYLLPQKPPALHSSHAARWAATVPPAKPRVRTERPPPGAGRPAGRRGTGVGNGGRRWTSHP